MSENSPEDLVGAIERLQQLSARLLDVLERERQALVDRSPGNLNVATADKAELCAAIDRAAASLGPVPLSEQIAAQPQALRARLEPAHAELVCLAKRTRDCNAVNGKILRRSQQSVRELMHLMSGTETEGLYSGQGYTAQGQPGSGSQGTAIAKA